MKLPDLHAAGRIRAALAAGAAAVLAAGAIALNTAEHGTLHVGSVANADDWTVNPYYTAFQAMTTGPLSDGDQRASTNDESPTDPNGGLVVVRLFIPDQYAAANNELLGDDRITAGGKTLFSPDPTASARATLIWNTATGEVTLIVSHSTKAPSYAHGYIPPTPIAALPLSNHSWDTVWSENGQSVRDQIRYDNRFGIDSVQDGGPELHVRLSLLNPMTNSGFLVSNLGAWSVDYGITLLRSAEGTYTVAQMDGNGYPAIEAYYYPPSSLDGSPIDSVIVERDVDRKEPAIVQGRQIPQSVIGDGAGAEDTASWNNCWYSGPTSYTCQNTMSVRDSWTTSW